MKFHNVSTIEVLESRLSDHNHDALVVANEIQTNLDDLENYLFQVGKSNSSRRFARGSKSANSSKDNSQGYKL
jgi:hypothetical protein